MEEKYNTQFLCKYRIQLTFTQLISCIVIYMFLFSYSLTASYIPIYTVNTNGGLSFTGNTLGLNKAENQNQPGTNGSIGAFITSDMNAQVGNYPLGTTLDWQNNFSDAVLDIPPNSIVLHAELIWSGSYGFGNTIPLNGVDVPINFITPDNTVHSIAPNPLTAQSRVQTGNTGFYVRSADVTSLVSNISGKYVVGGIPATVVSTENNLNCAGWTLAVAYSNAQMVTSNLTIFVGCEASGAKPALVNWFYAPHIGNVTSVLFSSCLEGDPQLIGDHFLIGEQLPLSYPINSISGPNNPTNNFFGSQINTSFPLIINSTTGKLTNNGSATLDTRGSFGAINSNILTGTAISGARQGYDITAIDIGDFIKNDQTQFYAQGTTDQDVYTVNSLGLQIQVLAPLIQSTLEVDQTTITLDSLVTYTSTFKNIGEALATNLIFTDNLPTGLTFKTNSVNVNGINIPGADIATGISIGDLSVNGSVVVSFQAVVSQFNPPNTFDNFSNVVYTFVPLNSTAPTVGLSSQTNTVEISGAVIPLPIANPDTADTASNITLSGLNVLTNDTGVDITVTSYDPTSANAGSVVVQPNGIYTYNSYSNFSGVDTFNYTITDSIGQSASTTVTITVFPVAMGDSATVASNTLLNQNTSVLTNDLGSNLTVSTYDSTSAQGGSIVMSSDGTYTYLSALNFSGTDTFNYTVIDSSRNTATGVVTIRVLPVAENDVGSTSANIPLNGSTVFTNDVGKNLKLVSYDQISAQNGQIIMNMDDGTYVYTPPLNFSGVDTFTYTVQDQNGDQSVATVTITVLPVAKNDAGVTTANTPLNSSKSVLDNDLGNNLIIQSYNSISTQGGTILMQTDGMYVYTPPINYSGPDSFRYTVEDTIENVTTARINLNVLPVANSDIAITSANLPFTGPSVLNNDVGTQLMIQSSQSISDKGGKISMNIDGTYTYFPPLNFSGTDAFNYTAVDFYGNTVNASVTVSVKLIANNEVFSTTANTLLNGNLLSNDIGSNLSTLPLNQNTSNGGIIKLLSNGNFSYNPPLNFSGTDTFTYTIIDDNGNTATANASIIILPIASNDVISTSVNIPVNSESVLVNDVGSYLQISSYDSISQAGGKIVMNLQTGVYTYTPPPGFIGLDSFMYTIVDKEGKTSTANVFISIYPVIPPQCFEGKIEKHKFLNKDDLLVKMSWCSSISSDIVSYRIYYKQKLVTEISANQRLVFKKCISSIKSANDYSITAVNSGGAESMPLKIRIKHE